MPDDADRELDADDEFWRARVTGKEGQTNVLVWIHDDQLYTHWEWQGHRFFLMNDELSVREAVEHGVTPLLETDFVVGL